MAMTIELKPCPFCAKQPASQWFAACAPDEDCGYWGIDCCVVHIHEDNEADAVVKWNRRIHPTQPAQTVEEVELRFTSGNSVPVERATVRDHEWQTIRQALRDHEAEIARLTYRLETADGYGEQCDNDIRALLDRAEKAEALLRECQQFLSTYHPADQRLSARITAHLGAEQ
jgi:hypothetical protein